MGDFRDENIISYKEAFLEEVSSCLCIVMELAEGGDLQNKINEKKRLGMFFEEKEIWSIFG